MLLHLMRLIRSRPCAIAAIVRRTMFPVARLTIVVLATGAVVYWSQGTTPATAQTGRAKAAEPTARAKQSPLASSAGTKAETLPMPVVEMREAILSAARSGRIEEMKTAIELNELKPEFGASPVPDPITYWRQISGDGEGREILAEAINILEMPFAVVPFGKDIENSRIFVWPYLAETALDKLTPPQEVDLLRIVSPDEAKDMKAKKKYTGWRLAIGADGTWHSFRKAE